MDIPESDAALEVFNRLEQTALSDVDRISDQELTNLKGFREGFIHDLETLRLYTIALHILTQGTPHDIFRRGIIIQPPINNARRHLEFVTRFNSVEDLNEFFARINHYMHEQRNNFTDIIRLRHGGIAYVRYPRGEGDIIGVARLREVELIPVGSEVFVRVPNVDEVNDFIARQPPMEDQEQEEQVEQEEQKERPLRNAVREAEENYIRYLKDYLKEMEEHRHTISHDPDTYINMNNTLRRKIQDALEALGNKKERIPKRLRERIRSRPTYHGGSTDASIRLPDIYLPFSEEVERQIQDRYRSIREHVEQRRRSQSIPPLESPQRRDYRVEARPERVRAASVRASRRRHDDAVSTAIRVYQRHELTRKQKDRQEARAARYAAEKIRNADVLRQNPIMALRIGGSGYRAFGGEEDSTSTERKYPMRQNFMRDMKGNVYTFTTIENLATRSRHFKDCLLECLDITTEGRIRKLVPNTKQFRWKHYIRQKYDLGQGYIWLDNIQTLLADIYALEPAAYKPTIVHPVYNYLTQEHIDKWKAGQCHILIAKNNHMSVLKTLEIVDFEVITNKKHSFYFRKAIENQLSQRDGLLFYDFETWVDRSIPCNSTGFLIRDVICYINYRSKSGEFKERLFKTQKKPNGEYYSAARQFLDWLLEQPIRYTCYAHNSSGFDVYCLLHSMYDHEIARFFNKDEQCIRIGFNVVCFTFHNHKFADSCKFLQNSLKNLAKAFLHDKPELWKMEEAVFFDRHAGVLRSVTSTELCFYGIMEGFTFDQFLALEQEPEDADKPRFWEAYIEYCRRDVIALREIWLRFMHSDYNMRLRMTTDVPDGQKKRVIFARTSLTKSITIGNHHMNLLKAITTGQEAWRLVRKGIRLKPQEQDFVDRAKIGGMSIVAQPGLHDHRVMIFDVKSLYPLSAMTGLYPGGIATFTSIYSPDGVIRERSIETDVESTVDIDSTDPTLDADESEQEDTITDEDKQFICDETDNDSEAEVHPYFALGHARAGIESDSEDIDSANVRESYTWDEVYFLPYHGMKKPGIYRLRDLCFDISRCEYNLFHYHNRQFVYRPVLEMDPDEVAFIRNTLGLGKNERTWLSHATFIRETYCSTLVIEFMLRFMGLVSFNVVESLIWTDWIHGKHLFGKHIETCYHIKAEQDQLKTNRDPTYNAGLREAVKLGMNSITGKLGQKNTNQLEASVTELEEPVVQFDWIRPTQIRLENNKVQKRRPDMCNLLSFLYEHSKLVMFRYFMAIPNLGDDLIAVETDSIHIRASSETLEQFRRQIQQVSATINIPVVPVKYSTDFETKELLYTQDYLFDPCPEYGVACTKLGALELEKDACRGIYVSKKKYMVMTDDNTIYMKMSGLVMYETLLSGTTRSMLSIYDYLRAVELSLKYAYTRCQQQFKTRKDEYLFRLKFAITQTFQSIHKHLKSWSLIQGKKIRSVMPNPTIRVFDTTGSIVPDERALEYYIDNFQKFTAPLLNKQ